jgi:hypothetical protein
VYKWQTFSLPKARAAGVFQRLESARLEISTAQNTTPWPIDRDDT